MTFGISPGPARPQNGKLTEVVNLRRVSDR
jgi:hypothetical protein